MKAWSRTKLDIACNKATATELSCERLAEYHIVTSETSGSYSGATPYAPADRTQQLTLSYQSHKTGAGAKARRNAARAADRATQGLPPSAHMPDWIPE